VLTVLGAAAVLAALALARRGVRSWGQRQ
jgi:hypothetical protein